MNERTRRTNGLDPLESLNHVSNPRLFADYTFGELKFGGNAQYISKKRWLHHTSFLWDYDPKRMRCLLHPPKEPEYRRKRNHLDFLCRLKDFIPERQVFLRSIEDALEQSNFVWEEVGLDEVKDEVDKLLQLPPKQNIQSTKRIIL